MGRRAHHDPLHRGRARGRAVHPEQLRRHGAAAVSRPGPEQRGLRGAALSGLERSAAQRGDQHRAGPLDRGRRPRPAGPRAQRDPPADPRLGDDLGRGERRHRRHHRQRPRPGAGDADRELVRRPVRRLPARERPQGHPAGRALAAWPDRRPATRIPRARRPRGCAPPARAARVGADRKRRGHRHGNHPGQPLLAEAEARRHPRVRLRAGPRHQPAAAARPARPQGQDRRGLRAPLRDARPSPWSPARLLNLQSTQGRHRRALP